jgi:glutamate/tyrosine decarboxylase-like PLP-dependent enzyme
MDLGAYLDAARAFDEGFRGRWEPVPAAKAAAVGEERLAAAWAEYTERLQDNYPFFHPRYAGQMLKPPHPVAMAGYLAAMTVNPNNHALDGGPATGAMEKEVVGDLAPCSASPATPWAT